MKFVFLFLPSVILIGGCAFLGGPALSSELSRKEAIVLYNGGIAEKDWLARLDTVSRKLPMPDTSSVQLADGFLFYKTDLKGETTWIVDVIPAADAPDVEKTLARSLRKDVEPARILKIDGGLLCLDGREISELDLIDEAEHQKKKPKTQRSVFRVFVGGETFAQDLARIQNLLKNRGIEIETIYESPTH